MKHPNWQALKSYEAKQASRPSNRRSAVLIPILDLPGNPILYTQRSFQLKHHAGQISFPGGVVEKGETVWQAALREASEEVGIPEEAVTPIGRLDDVFSPRGFHIACLVGKVKPFTINLNSDEVERVLTVPLEELSDSLYHQVLPWKNHRIHFFHFPSGLVWGVTGQITFGLKKALASCSKPS